MIEQAMDEFKGLHAVISPGGHSARHDVPQDDRPGLGHGRRCASERQLQCLPRRHPQLPPPRGFGYAAASFPTRSHSMPAMTMVQAIQDALRVALREDPARGDAGRGRRPERRRVPRHRGTAGRVRRGARASTRRSPRTASSAARSAWRSTACDRSPRSSSSTSSTRPSTRSCRSWPRCAGARAGQYTCPVIVRAPYGGGIRGGLYHSQSPEAYFCHTAGLHGGDPVHARATRRACCSRRSTARTR